MAKIVCLGWGSLIWNPLQLPLSDGWCIDGPPIRVEFARMSDDGRITLVLTRQANYLPSLWAPLTSLDIEDARAALSEREKTPLHRIGSWPHGEYDAELIHDLPLWAEKHEVDGIVWTALQPRFNGVNGKSPTIVQVVRYLEGLTGETRRIAEEYIRRTPAQIDTEFRRAIESALGWAPIEAATQ